MRKRIRYIDGLKGMSCILIVCGHFWGLYKYCIDTGILENKILNVGKHIPLVTVLDESFWLQIFLVVSGYLIALTSISSVSDLIKKIFIRAVRFVLPIAGACWIIYLLYLTIGFHNSETSALFTNDWFQTYYLKDISLADVILEPFFVIIRPTRTFNGPYWVIAGMFYSAILTYFYILIIKKIGGKKSKNFFSFLLLVVAILSKSKVMCACITGTLIREYEENISRFISRWRLKYIMFLIFVLMPFGGQHILQIIFSRIPHYGVLVANCLDLTGYWRLMYISLFFIVVLNSFKLQKFFSENFFLFLGRISFGIYSLHWPIICSIGARIILYLYKMISGGVLPYFISFLICIIITLVLSWLYSATIEKYAMRIVEVCKKWLSV